MPTPIEMEIRNAVENFVNELAELVRDAAVESVTIALGGDGARRPRASASAGRTGHARRKGEKRSPEEIQSLQNRLLAAISKTPGLRKEQLATELDASTKDLMLVTNKLLADRAIRKRGVKRATMYYAR